MNKNNYIPRPIDTKGVVLPKELNALAEEIAKNVHEVWSEGRMKEGWTYGEKRDDARKHHPCLVPYEELTETEKEYDTDCTYSSQYLTRNTETYYETRIQDCEGMMKLNLPSLRL